MTFEHFLFINKIEIYIKNDIKIFICVILHLLIILTIILLNIFNSISSLNTFNYQ